MNKIHKSGILMLCDKQIILCDISCERNTNIKLRSCASQRLSYLLSMFEYMTLSIMLFESAKKKISGLICMQHMHNQVKTIQDH